MRTSSFFLGSELKKLKISSRKRKLELLVIILDKMDSYEKGKTKENNHASGNGVSKKNFPTSIQTKEFAE